jgi:hypothetical protein
MAQEQAVIQGDDTLRIRRDADNVTVTVAYREGRLPSGPGLQYRSITITLPDFIDLLAGIGLDVKEKPETD